MKIKNIFLKGLQNNLIIVVKNEINNMSISINNINNDSGNNKWISLYLLLKGKVLIFFFKLHGQVFFVKMYYTLKSLICV